MLCHLCEQLVILEGSQLGIVSGSIGGGPWDCRVDACGGGIGGGPWDCRVDACQEETDEDCQWYGHCVVPLEPPQQLPGDTSHMSLDMSGVTEGHDGYDSVHVRATRGHIKTCMTRPMQWHHIGQVLGSG